MSTLCTRSHDWGHFEDHGTPGRTSPLEPTFIQTSNSRRLCSFFDADWNVGRHMHREGDKGKSKPNALPQLSAAPQEVQHALREVGSGGIAEELVLLSRLDVEFQRPLCLN